MSRMVLVQAPDSYLNVPDGVGPGPIHIFYTYGNIKCAVKLIPT